MARGMGLVGVAGVGHWGKPCESSNRLELLEVCVQYVEACMQHMEVCMQHMEVCMQCVEACMSMWWLVVLMEGRVTWLTRLGLQDIAQGMAGLEQQAAPVMHHGHPDNMI